MARTRNANYRADPPPGEATDFEWATADNEPFNRELDMSYVATALDRHDHRAGRGLAVGRIDAGAITAGALASNSVATAALQDLAVTTAKLADNSVTTAKILDGTIKGADMEPDAIKDRLGYIPINKAGDSEVGSLSFGKVGPPAVSNSVTFLNDGGIGINQGSISGAGSISLVRTVAGNTAHFQTKGGLAITGRNETAGADGYGLGILNDTGSLYDLIVSHIQAVFTVPTHGPTFHSNVAAGTAPFTAQSTTTCPNLNAQYLNGQPSSYYAPTTNQVPGGAHCFFWTAANVPTGWTRNSNLDGRILVGGGTATGVTGTPITFIEHAQSTGSSWSVSGGAHTHTLNQHRHFHNNMPNATGVAGPGGQFVLLGVDYGPESWPSGDTVTGSTGGASSWNFPTYAMVLAYK